MTTDNIRTIDVPTKKMKTLLGGLNIQRSASASESDILICRIKKRASFLCAVNKHGTLSKAVSHTILLSDDSRLSQSLEADDHIYWQEFAQSIANISRVTNKRMAKMITPLIRHKPKVNILDLACGNNIYGFTLTSQFKNAYLTIIDWPTTQPAWQKTAAQFGLLFISENLFNTKTGDKKLLKNANQETIK